jgi:DNA-directed RNA polymerase sigma subunit (sigma70/sigma32)
MIDKDIQKRMDEVLAQADYEASLTDARILEMIIEYLSNTPQRTLDEISKYLKINGNRIARIVVRNSRFNTSPLKYNTSKRGRNIVVTVYTKNI